MVSGTLYNTSLYNNELFLQIIAKKCMFYIASKLFGKGLQIEREKWDIFNLIIFTRNMNQINEKEYSTI